MEECMRLTRSCTWYLLPPTPSRNSEKCLHATLLLLSNPRTSFKQYLADNPVRIFNSVLYSILITHTVSGAQSFTEGIFIPLIVGFPKDSIEYFMSSVLLNALGKHPDVNFFVCMWFWGRRGQIRERNIFRP